MIKNKCPFWCLSIQPEQFKKFSISYLDWLEKSRSSKIATSVLDKQAK